MQRINYFLKLYNLFFFILYKIMNYLPDPVDTEDAMYQRKYLKYKNKLEQLKNADENAAEDEAEAEDADVAADVAEDAAEDADEDADVVAEDADKNAVADENAVAKEVYQRKYLKYQAKLRNLIQEQKQIIRENELASLPSPVDTEDAMYQRKYLKYKHKLNRLLH